MNTMLPPQWRLPPVQREEEWLCWQAPYLLAKNLLSSFASSFQVLAEGPSLPWRHWPGWFAKVKTDLRSLSCVHLLFPGSPSE